MTARVKSLRIRDIKAGHVICILQVYAHHLQSINYKINKTQAYSHQYNK